MTLIISCLLFVSQKYFFIEVFNTKVLIDSHTLVYFEMGKIVMLLLFLHNNNGTFSRRGKHSLAVFHAGRNNGIWST